MTSSPFDPFIAENGFVLLDGGLATEFEAQGADLSCDLWSARLLNDNPSLIRETHLAYYRAGADVATSASYQASYEGFLRKGFDRIKATKLLLLSVKLAVEARDLFWQEYQQQCSQADEPPLQTSKAQQQQQQQQQQRQRWGKRLRPLVAASVGCYGAAVGGESEYRGDYGSRVGWPELKAWHKERLEVLAGAEGVDFVLFETVPCLAEVRAILSLLQDLRPSVSAVISVSCRDDVHLRSGELLRDFADLVHRHAQEPGTGRDGGGSEGSRGAGESAACVGIGVNCTDPDHIAGALRTLAAATAESSCDRGARIIGGAAATATAATDATATVVTAAAATAVTSATAASTAITVAVATAATEAAAATETTAATATASRSADNTAAVHQEENTPTAVGNTAAAPEPSNAGKPPQLLLVAYPNSGEVWDAIAKDWVEGTRLRGEDGDGSGGVGEVETFARMARDEWYTAGSAARVFGGCCRTRPAHITEIRRALSALVSSQERAALPRSFES